MTAVIRGFCPDCGRSERYAGATCWSFPPLGRVVACSCGSRTPPVATLPAGREAWTTTALAPLEPGVQTHPVWDMPGRRHG